MRRRTAQVVRNPCFPTHLPATTGVLVRPSRSPLQAYRQYGLQEILELLLRRVSGGEETIGDGVLDMDRHIHRLVGVSCHMGFHARRRRAKTSVVAVEDLRRFIDRVIIHLRRTEARRSRRFHLMSFDGTRSTIDHTGPATIQYLSSKTRRP